MTSTLGTRPEHGTYDVALWVNKFLQKKNVRGAATPQSSCRNGHKYVDGSFLVRENGTRKCLACDVERRKRAASKRKLGSSVAYRSLVRLEKTLNGEKIKLNRTQAEKQDSFNLAADAAWENTGKRISCIDDPDSYFFELEEIVTDDFAVSLCAGCPLMGSGVCFDYSKSISSKFQKMVSEGVILVGSKIVKGDKVD